ncbi:MAG TPA: hypothetical protein VFW19_18165 [Allosphingosinicella sp.]|nr:hypothetical protein [Allosphingosinicella sp.]
MRKFLLALVLPALALGTAACQVGTQSGNGTAAGAQESAAAGVGGPQAPEPAMNAPDKTAWDIFIEAVKPGAGSESAFQGWASDTDTFKPNAVWPAQAQAQTNVEAKGKLGAPHALLGRPALRPHRMLEAGAVQQQGIPNPAPPSTEPGADNNLIEEVFRDHPAFDFIVGNHLNSRSGLIAAFKAGTNISFPADSVEVKTNWIPVADLGKYYPGVSADQFYVASQGGTQYALIAMHVISKLVPNWTWATFEHQANPGRCDFIGCNDTYGAENAHVAPLDNQGQNQGQTYPACTKTHALQSALKAAGVAAVFANYCLKGSQTDFTDNTGLAVRLGNTVTEYSFVPQASCMTCHGEANFTSAGQSTTKFGFIGGNGQVGPINPLSVGYWKTSGAPPPYPLYQGMPGLIRNAGSADFVWSIPFCAYDDVTDPKKPAPSPCVGK